MDIDTLVVGPFQVNCYLASVKGQALVIDPGADATMIMDAVGHRTVRAILLTHAHLDHVGAVRRLAETLNAPILLHPDDLALYDSPENAMPGFYPYEEKPRPVSESSEITESCGVEILHTPGHSPGGVCYHFPDEKVVFTGDTLFCGSIGRDDLPGGNHALMIESIRTQLMTLPDDVDVYPGHGPPSTIGRERAGNPFLA